jgi:hypothetical protein
MDRAVLVRAVLDAVELGDVEDRDVVTVHLGTRTVSIRRRVRGRSGKVVPGLLLTTSHDVLPEPLED